MTGGLGVHCIHAKVVHNMSSRVGVTVLHGWPAGSWMCIGLCIMLVCILIVSNYHCFLLLLPWTQLCVRKQPTWTNETHCCQTLLEFLMQLKTYTSMSLCWKLTPNEQKLGDNAEIGWQLSNPWQLLHILILGFLRRIRSTVDLYYQSCMQVKLGTCCLL